MVKIEIVHNIKEKMNQSWAYADKALKGKIKIDKKKTEKAIIMTPEIFSKIFSPERMKLILRIKRNRIENIYQLAKQLNRKYEAVHRDIKLLEGFGLIKIKEKDKKKIPFIDKAIKMPVIVAG